MKEKRQIILAVLFIIFLSSQIFGQDDKNGLTAERIVEKHIAAIGGREKLNSIRTRVALGVVKVAKIGRPTAFALFSESDNRLSVWYRLEQFDWSLIFDGKTFSSRPMELLSRNVVLIGRSARLEEKFSEMYSSGLMFGELSLYNILLNANPDVTIKANKTKKINDRPAYVVEIKQKSSGSMKAYFDVETFMWVRTDFGSVELGDTNLILNNSGGAITIIDFFQEYSDFREVDGVRLPYKFTHMIIPPVSPNSRAAVVEVEITEYKHNLRIDPKMFQ